MLQVHYHLLSLFRVFSIIRRADFAENHSYAFVLVYVWCWTESILYLWRKLNPVLVSFSINWVDVSFCHSVMRLVMRHADRTLLWCIAIRKDRIREIQRAAGGIGVSVIVVPGDGFCAKSAVKSLVWYKLQKLPLTSRQCTFLTNWASNFDGLWDEGIEKCHRRRTPEIFSNLEITTVEFIIKHVCRALNSSVDFVVASTDRETNELMLVSNGKVVVEALGSMQE